MYGCVYFYVVHTLNSVTKRSNTVTWGWGIDLKTNREGLKKNWCKFLSKAKKKYMCVYCHMSKKSRVGRSGLIIIFFFKIIDKTGNSRSRFRNPIPVFNFSKIPVKWRIMQFFYLLCSQFRQKANSWINKTLLLVKQQKWLSEFSVKMHRVASKN
jgi:hypothetical protein